ncbi:unnamed protein product [Mortierella alpina]
MQWKQKPPDDHFQRQRHHHLRTQFHLVKGLDMQLCQPPLPASEEAFPSNSIMRQHMTGLRPKGVQDVRMTPLRYETQSLENLNVDCAYAWSPLSAKAETGDHVRRDSLNSEPKKDTVSLDADDTSEETSSDLRSSQAAHPGGELCEVFGSMVLDRHGSQLDSTTAILADL